MDRITSFIQMAADEAYDEFYKQGHAIQGNNGPYKYTDTPVRNTAHWLIVYSYLWKTTKNEKYYNISIRFANFLVEKERLTKSGAIECMTGDDFDHLNGLIGQAWVVEALVYAAETLSNNMYYEVALSIYNSQCFDENAGLWKRVEIDGTVLGYDYTVNHQVWYAIAGCMLNAYKRNSEIEQQINLFLQAINDSHFRVYRDGLIRHYLDVNRPNGSLSFHAKLKRFIKDTMFPLRRKDPHRFDSRAQEKGYHVFELYGYAILASYCPNATVFDSVKFKRALAYGLNIKKLNKELNINALMRKSKYAQMNKYAYGYNSPAFELPYVNLIFRNERNEEMLEFLFDIQCRLTCSGLSKKFDKNNFDAETLTARLYEYVRYIDTVNKGGN